MPAKSLGVALLTVLVSAVLAQPPASPKNGAEAVEELLNRCLASVAIVPYRDPKTNELDKDPKLGIPRFIVPDRAKLAGVIKTNRALMAPDKARHALRGCTQLAATNHAPGWVTLLRAVGQELDDPVSVELSYHVAAQRGLPKPTQKAFDDLKLLVNRAIEREALQYHRSATTGWTWLTVRREAGKGVVSLFPVPPVADLDERVTFLTDPQVLKSLTVQEAADELSGVLLSPLADSLAGQDLLIIPTGPLCRLPFELLREPSSNGRKYLGETRNIRYAPSLTVLRLLLQRQRLKKDKPDRPALLVADPVDPAVPSDALNPSPLPPLPMAAKEARMVARVLRAEEDAVWVGKDATKAGLLKRSASGELKRYRVLTLPCMLRRRLITAHCLDSCWDVPTTTATWTWKMSPTST